MPQPSGHFMPRAKACGPLGTPAPQSIVQPLLCSGQVWKVLKPILEKETLKTGASDVD